MHAVSQLMFEIIGWHFEKKSYAPVEFNATDGTNIGWLFVKKTEVEALLRLYLYLYLCEGSSMVGPVRLTKEKRCIHCSYGSFCALLPNTGLTWPNGFSCAPESSFTESGTFRRHKTLTLLQPKIVFTFTFYSFWKNLLCGSVVSRLTSYFMCTCTCGFSPKMHVKFIGDSKKWAWMLVLCVSALAREGLATRPGCTIHPKAARIGSAPQTLKLCLLPRRASHFNTWSVMIKSNETLTLLSHFSVSVRDWDGNAIKLSGPTKALM